MQAFIEMADRQYGELEEQKRQLEEGMRELKTLRDETAEALVKP